MDKIINHKFDRFWINTANKDNKKYLGKDGSQAYRVVVEINGEKYANMLWEEEFVPKKGVAYDIKLSEKDGWKNWEYKILTKKEQMKVQTQGNEPVVRSFEVNQADPPDLPPPPTSQHETAKPVKDDAYWDEVNRGKVRHGVACSMIEAGANFHEIPKEAINKWVEFIMTGE